MLVRRHEDGSCEISKAANARDEKVTLSTLEVRAGAIDDEFGVTHTRAQARHMHRLARHTKGYFNGTIKILWTRDHNLASSP
jgi:hypothetical protein